MSIQQVAASEEFPSETTVDDVVALPQATTTPEGSNKRSTVTGVQQSNDLEASVQSSLDLVGQGIQSLLSDSFTSVTDKQSSDIASLSRRFDKLVEQNGSLKRTNEEQRKVIVALVRKVAALENHATSAVQHHQRTEKRLGILEQPADLDSEWKDLLDNKGKSNGNEADSAA